MSEPLSYQAFLEAKACVAPSLGFDVDPGALNPALKPHTRLMVRWGLKGGRRAWFASFGLHKTATQLEAMRLVGAETGGPTLIILPLGVRQEFTREAERRFHGPHAVRTRFIRRADEIEPGTIHLTNYETIRDGKLDPGLFAGVSLDEAACLRGFGGSKTFREFMRLFDADTGGGRVPFRFVATATPSPNEHIELLAYAAFLGVMDVGQAKTRFFKRNSEKADTLTLHPHKQKEFWLWVASWALFIQKPSDICDCQCHVGKRFREFASDHSKLSSGSPAPNVVAPGCADAIAETSGSRHLITCSPAAFEAADASAPVTDKSTPLRTERGAACSTGSTAISATIRTAASPSASAGNPSRTSSPTWASPSPDTHSTGLKTTAAMSPAIVSGQTESNKPATPGAMSSSPLTDGSNPLPPGQKSSASATGNCTHATNTDGLSSACSEISCQQCEIWDAGYDLPALDVRWHELPATRVAVAPGRDGQGRLFASAAIGVSQAAQVKRDSLSDRVARMLEIRAEDPAANRLIWHDLEDERRAIEAALPSVVSVYGAQDLDAREAAVAAFAEGKINDLAAKPVMLGAGTNLQPYCAWEVFLGIGFKFADFIQAIHRTRRFGQPKKTVRIDLIYSEAERDVRTALERKWAQHEELVATMTALIREYGLTDAAMAAMLTRAIGVERIEVAGEGYRCINNDCVKELESHAANSVDLIVTSIPFGEQYEYSPNYADFGHTDNAAHFWAQMDYLIPQLLRVLKPGRCAMIHVKDRIVPGGINKLGFQTVYPFSDDCVRAFQAHGFAFLARKTVTTDVVRENNQTYRLGWSEQCKDGSRMGCGLPEYGLLFRKAPSDLSDGYADVPVAKAKPDVLDLDAGPVAWGHGLRKGQDERRRPVPGTGYSRGRWQLDAHGFARSAGNRLMTQAEMASFPAERIYKVWKAESLQAIYDFEHHVRIAEDLDAIGRLPPTFMLLPPHSWHPDVWSDITRMQTMNTLQAQAGREAHLCPLQFDFVDRAIAQFSQPGETVLDPFAGLMTVPLRALKLGRSGIGIELAHGYFRDGLAYVRAQAEGVPTPSLFDVLAAEPAPIAAE